MISAFDDTLVTILAVIILIFTAINLVQNWRLTNLRDNMSRLMHKELEIVSAQNAVLRTEINKLQQEVAQLNTKLVEICSELDKLQIEVANLANELNVFKRIIAVRKIKVSNAAS